MSAPGQRRRLRRLTGPAGRLVLLALTVAAAWGWWALRPYRPLTAWEAPCESVVRVELSADGTRLLAVGNTGAVDNVTADSYRLWDAATGRELAAAFDRAGVVDCRLTPDSRWLVAQTTGGAVTVRAVADGRVQLELPAPERGEDATRAWAVSPDGHALACERGGDPPAAQLWDLDAGRLVATLAGAGRPLAFSPDGRTLAARYGGDTEPDAARLRLWDVAGGREIARVCRMTDPRLRALAFSPDGRRLAVCPGTNSDFAHVPRGVTLWDLATGRPLATLYSLTNAGALEFSPDGRFLLARGGHGTGLLWDLATDPPCILDRLLHPWDEGGAKSFHFPLFAPQSNRLILESGSYPGPVGVIYDTTTLAPVATCGSAQRRHSPEAPTVSPDGRLLAYIEMSDAVPRWETWAEQLFGGPRPWHRLKFGVRCFDLVTGADQGWLPSLPEWIGFAPDSRSVWTYTQVSEPASGEVRLQVRRGAVPSPRPPAWLIGVTAGAVLLAAAGRWRSRRRRAGLSAGAAGGYPALQGGPPP